MYYFVLSYLQNNNYLRQSVTTILPLGYNSLPPFFSILGAISYSSLLLGISYTLSYSTILSRFNRRRLGRYNYKEELATREETTREETTREEATREKATREEANREEATREEVANRVFYRV